jgi:hypothetical protein
LALFCEGELSSLSDNNLPLFEAATLARSPIRDLNIFTPGEVVTLWLKFVAEGEPAPYAREQRKFRIFNLTYSE